MTYCVGLLATLKPNSGGVWLEPFYYVVSTMMGFQLSLLNKSFMTIIL